MPNSYLWERNCGVDGSILFLDLPLTFQAEVAQCINLDIILKVPLFNNVNDPGFLRMLSLMIRPILYLPGDNIVQKGDIGAEMFFLQVGVVQVVDETGTQVFSTMKSGDFFGEISLLFSCPRTASIRAATHCDLFVLSKNSFETVLEYYPQIRDKIKNIAQERLKQEISEKEAKARKIQEAAQAAMQQDAEAKNQNPNSNSNSKDNEKVVIQISNPADAPSRKISNQKPLNSLRNSLEVHPQ
eukprot:Sdes_comp18791_c0_seq2m9197